MPDIKIIDEKTDFNKLDIHLLRWDLEINGTPYDVYRINEYYHCIGGKYGNNDYWCCRSDEEPSYKTLKGFNGVAPTWTIEWSQNNYIRNKWGESEVEYTGRYLIKRNGKVFCTGGARDIDYGLAKAQSVLIEIQEYSISFGDKDWQRKVENRKVYYKEEPAIIKNLMHFEDCGYNLWIIPDKECIKQFRRPGYMNGDIADHYDEYKNGLKDDLLTSSIYWFRDEEKKKKKPNKFQLMDLE